VASSFLPITQTKEEESTIQTNLFTFSKGKKKKTSFLNAVVSIVKSFCRTGGESSRHTQKSIVLLCADMRSPYTDLHSL
jgi:hypothetical protein